MSHLDDVLVANEVRVIREREEEVQAPGAEGVPVVAVLKEAPFVPHRNPELPPT